LRIHIVPDKIINLKQQPGKDMLLNGGPDLVSEFIHLGLIDEFRIGIVPVLLGSGKVLFKNGNDRINLKLLKTIRLKSGIIIHHYIPLTRLPN
jgi:dihydrofolate reductase